MEDLRFAATPMNPGIFLIIVLFLAFIGVLPTWGYSQKWGPAPAGSVGAVLLIFLILWLLGVF
jgi:hypothetical protein